MKKLNITFVLITSFVFLLTTKAQWQKHVIDDENISLAVNVDVANMVGDKNPDLVVANFIEGQAILYENDFPNWNKHIIGTGNGITFTYCGDMDVDNEIDVVVCAYNARELVWYENNNNYWPKNNIDINTDHADHFLVADIDNDDTLDVITAGSTIDGGDVLWYENNHPNWIKHIIESGSGHYPTLNVADFNGDGLLDLAATMSHSNKVVWFRNENAGQSWTKYTIDDSLSNPFGLNSGDINGDDKIDIVAANGGPYFDGDNVVWYENNLPNWTKHIIDTNLPGANFPGVADVDGDDTMDVIVTVYTTDDVVWYKNEHPIWTKQLIDDNLNGPRVFALIDVDGDNINDLVVPGYTSVVWYKNPFTTVAYGQSLDVYPKYLAPTGDTIKITTQICNPENHQVEVHAFIQDKKLTFKDSLQLFDDGLHNDNFASDNIYGGIKSLTEHGENFFQVKLLTTDSDESLNTYCANVGHFTSIPKPTIIAVDVIDGPFPYDYRLKLKIRNNSNLNSLSSLSLKVTSPDSSITNFSSEISFPSIIADSSATNSNSFLVMVNKDTFGGELNFDFEICVDEYAYWYDSLRAIPTEVNKSLIIPNEFSLSNNFPNPFNPSTNISYSIPSQSNVTLEVFDVLGREVSVLVKKEQPVGNYKVEFDASNLTSGVYFYRIQAGDFVESKKMVLMK